MLKLLNQDNQTETNKQRDKYNDNEDYDRRYSEEKDMEQEGRLSVIHEEECEESVMPQPRKQAPVFNEEYTESNFNNF